MEISFIVPATPVPQPRPRAVKFGGQARMHELTHVKGADGRRREHPIVAFKATVRMAYEELQLGPPLADCDIALTLICVMPRTKACEKYGPGRLPYRVKKNDWDNLGKSVCDALNQRAWVDDGLIHAAYVERWYAAADETPHCAITIRRLDDPVKLVKVRGKKTGTRKDSACLF